MAIDKISKPIKGVEIEDGTHRARFIGLVHLGIQKNDATSFGRGVTYDDQVLLSFELSDIVLPDGRPVILSSRLNYKLGKKATLLKVGKALNGGKDISDGIDWEENIGKPLMLQIEENSKGTGSNIKGYSTILEKDKKTLPPMINEPKLFFDVDSISSEELGKMGKWLQKIINDRVKDEDPSRPDTNY